MIYAPFIGLLVLWFVAALSLLGQTFLQRKPQSPHLTSQYRASWLIHSFVLVSAFMLALYLPALVEVTIGTSVHQHASHQLLHHWSHTAQSPSFWLLLWLSFIALLWILWATILPFYRWFQLNLKLHQLKHVATCIRLSHKEIEKLSALSKGSFEDRHFTVVPGTWVGLAGILRPTLLLGLELLQKLNEEELQAILAHEEAHYQRKDPFWRFAFLLVSRLFPYWGHQWFCEWSTDTEILCDAQASSTLEDPTLLAATLIKVQRLQIQSKTANLLRHQHGSPLLGLLQESNLELRVHALLSGTTPQHQHSFSRLSLSMILLLSLLLIFNYQKIHCSIEQFFNWLLF